jgi:hypothetical protein
MKNTLIDEIVKPLNDILDSRLKDVNGDKIDVSYLGYDERKILADLVVAIKTVRKDLDKLFGDLFEPEDIYDDNGD